MAQKFGRHFPRFCLFYRVLFECVPRRSVRDFLSTIKQSCRALCGDGAFSRAAGPVAEAVGMSATVWANVSFLIVT